jgi:hypothetical protein
MRGLHDTITRLSSMRGLNFPDPGGADSRLARFEQFGSNPARSTRRLMFPAPFAGAHLSL